jgi:hypothetical protein
MAVNERSRRMLYDRLEEARRFDSMDDRFARQTARSPPR